MSVIFIILLFSLGPFCPIFLCSYFLPANSSSTKKDWLFYGLTALAIAVAKPNIFYLLTLWHYGHVSIGLSGAVLYYYFLPIGGFCSGLIYSHGYQRLLGKWSYSIGLTFITLLVEMYLLIQFGFVENISTP